ncbi:undecaprenyl-phosphate glucose phosphotransferase [Vibrio genomosp. F10]|uniref:Undecaprenyl-phosphate glucose phosphotransferase n=1 Tax=Vibrio genomosp. F10 str. ZF-129 TaxID=1187848 RepID=A0A1E5BFA9_9VIBR|nr:undecaprenyl-phosphate glucose phosphotransferase [Vibrio genomosp. F10]OEE34482.1 undecaprenyl-phosphate glucose phosphotransferase [Vibrio genomosp. F10 str. ZF-129]OEE96205.1 undecaprenyl-phosphate glucose phosphotransferase [Vibrio genomosp. F10 str. 9ZD137]OEE98591.1 undecaprenyl-phosphate glucose phosphotransferase [Vibrio genomosp. F10 str. 9ZC157]OEF06303.1 undecaprenyl-phosphate glucose phosphotransferase [Vibrio genomosp. F10 str. 9ZB36]
MNHTGLIRSHETGFAFIYRITDASIVFSLLLIIGHFYLPTFTKDYLLIGALGTILFLLFGETVNLYRSWRTTSLSAHIIVTFSCWFICCITIVTVIYFTKLSDQFSRVVVGTWFLVTPLTLGLWRCIIRISLNALRRIGYNARRAIIVGHTEQGKSLAQELLNRPYHGVKFEGFYDERNTFRTDSKEDYPILGNVEDALNQAKIGAVDYVYIAMPMHANERIAKFLTQFSDTTANTYLVPDFFTYNLLHSRWDQVGHVQTLSVFDTPFIGIASWIKRLEDIVLSTIILCLISPLLIVIAVAVKFTSPGPVIFKQDRYGLDGRKIKVWKFRSMTTMEQGSEVKQATKNDARITPLGSFLRRTSLDELPQFFNALGGSMSIVGPRPHAVTHNEEYRQIVDRYMLRHKVKPGITGWAQVNGYRGETDTLDKMEKRVEFDLAYIHHWSIWMDIKIVFLTVFKGFTGKNAY